MKKSLVVTLALVFVLGIAGTALAANPFTDVPANHWAYAAVTKLAEDGIVDGYGDGRYIGNNTMTRYEMAQIVAKAMAKSDRADAAQRAQIERLAAEFADELDSLGVRVARLEKNADNVKITGEARFGHKSFDKHTESDRSQLRSRIWLRGEINDRWTYAGMFENTHELNTNNREGTVNLRRAWVDGNIGTVNVMAGRFAWAPVYGIVFDNDTDGIKFAYKYNSWKFEAFALRPNFENKDLRDLANPTASSLTSNNQVLGALVGWANNKVDATAAYYHTDPSGNDTIKSSIVELAVGYRFDQNWKLWAEYLYGSKSKELNDNSKSGWAAGLDIGQTKRNQPGSLAGRVRYFDVPSGASIDTTPELDITSWGDGYEGWQVGATWMVAKNIDVNVDYFDFEGQKSEQKEKMLWSYVRFYF